MQTIRKVNGAQKGLFPQLHTGMRSVSLSKSLTMDCPAFYNYSWSQIWETLLGWVSFPCHPERKLYRPKQMVATKLIPKALWSASLQGLLFMLPGDRGKASPLSDDRAEQRRGSLQTGLSLTVRLYVQCSLQHESASAGWAANTYQQIQSPSTSGASDLSALRGDMGVAAAVINGIRPKRCWCGWQTWGIFRVHWNVMYSSMCNKTEPDPGEEHLLVKYNLTFQSEHGKILTHQFREQDLLKHTSKLKVKAGLLHNV